VASGDPLGQPSPGPARNAPKPAISSGDPLGGPAPAAPAQQPAPGSEPTSVQRPSEQEPPADDTAILRPGDEQASEGKSSRNGGDGRPAKTPAESE
jgi:hypothetical protein